MKLNDSGTVKDMENISDLSKAIVTINSEHMRLLRNQLCELDLGGPNIMDYFNALVKSIDYSDHLYDLKHEAYVLAVIWDMVERQRELFPETPVLSPTVCDEIILIHNKISMTLLNILGGEFMSFIGHTSTELDMLDKFILFDSLIYEANGSISISFITYNTKD